MEYFLALDETPLILVESDYDSRVGKIAVIMDPTPTSCVIFSEIFPTVASTSIARFLTVAMLSLWSNIQFSLIP